MTFLIRFLGLVLSLGLLACVSPESPQARRERVSRLAEDLRGLRRDVTAAEAERLAVAAVKRAVELNGQWRPAKFAWMNNLFVNTGLRERGLCHHWREDLFPPLHHLRLKTLELHLAAARRATLREHNGIVVTAKGQPFEEGIILDAWRHGGVLEWGRVREDAYPWQPLPRELTPVELRPLLMPELFPR
jgi:hypothetical protein